MLKSVYKNLTIFWPKKKNTGIRVKYFSIQIPPYLIISKIRAIIQRRIAPSKVPSLIPKCNFAFAYILMRGIAWGWNMKRFLLLGWERCLCRWQAKVKVTCNRTHRDFTAPARAWRVQWRVQPIRIEIGRGSLKITFT